MSKYRDENKNLVEGAWQNYDFVNGTGATSHTDDLSIDNDEISTLVLRISVEAEASETVKIINNTGRYFLIYAVSVKLLFGDGAIDNIVSGNKYALLNGESFTITVLSEFQETAAWIMLGICNEPVYTN